MSLSSFQKARWVHLLLIASVFALPSPARAVGPDWPDEGGSGVAARVAVAAGAVLVASLAGLAGWAFGRRGANSHAHTVAQKPENAAAAVALAARAAEQPQQQQAQKPEDGAAALALAARAAEQPQQQQAQKLEDGAAAVALAARAAEQQQPQKLEDGAAAVALGARAAEQPQQQQSLGVPVTPIAHRSTSYLENRQLSSFFAREAVEVVEATQAARAASRQGSPTSFVSQMTTASGRTDLFALETLDAPSAKALSAVS